MTAPKRIPIYDATAPIACTIGADEIPERIELLERVRAELHAIERTTTGLLLHFSDEPAVRADLERFARDEKRCCRFWGFEVLTAADGVALRWDGPPLAEDLLAKVEHFFRTDEPISILNGIL